MGTSSRNDKHIEFDEILAREAAALHNAAMRVICAHQERIAAREALRRADEEFVKAEEAFLQASREKGASFVCEGRLITLPDGWYDNKPGSQVSVSEVTVL